jgi:iron complex outermembrane recepter protein
MGCVRLSWAALAVSLLGFGTHAASAQDRSYEFSIPRQAAVSALQLLARQANTPVIFSPEQLIDVRTNEVSGRFTAEEALMVLLRGSPLCITKSTQGALIVAGPPGCATQNTTKK